MLHATLQQRKHEVVRSAIWDAAIDLFAEKGYDETTVEDIAARAGVSRRSFFRYFASKNDLVSSGLAVYGTYIVEAIEGCPAGYSGSRVFRETVLSVARLCTTQPRARKMMQIVARYPAASEAQHSRSRELRERVEAAFAARKKPFGNLDPAVIADLTLAVLQVIFQSWFEREGQEISETVERVLATLSRLV